MSLGFFFDLNRCTGCRACCLACSIENGIDPEGSWRDVSTFNELRHPEHPLFHLSLACNHCTEAPCLAQCPARAISRNEETGAVIIDPDYCIGCRYCSWTCPFDAPKFDQTAGVMTKCNICSARLAEGREPACTAACPTGALTVGEMDEAAGVAVVRGFPVTSYAPSIRFEPLRGKHPLPELTSPPPLEAVDDLFRLTHLPAKARITLRSEWPLALFTFLASLLTARFAASLSGVSEIDPAGFLGAGLGAMALSALHLGRKERAGRAALNVKSSWLSREIVLFILFLLPSAAFLILAANNAVFQWAVLAAGLVALYSIDRVYDPVREGPPPWLHSADTVQSSLFLAAVFLGAPVLFLPVGLLRLILYLRRKAAPRGHGERSRPAWSVFRVGIGFIVPLILWFYDREGAGAAAAAAACAGELVDRCEFYSEIDVRSPARLMADDLLSLTAR